MGNGRAACSAYCQAVQALDHTETLLGEMAARLADLADALTDDPSSILTQRRLGMPEFLLSERLWPGYDEILELLDRWEAHYRHATGIWADLSERERQSLPPPQARKFNPLTPVV